MSAAILTIKDDTPAEFDFNLSISGVGGAEPDVRFVIEGVNGYNISIPCRRSVAGTWTVQIPPLRISESLRPFKIEVITEGYYFSPATGQVQIEHQPSVTIADASFQSNPVRPVVEAALKSARATLRLPLREYASLDAEQRKTYAVQCNVTGSVLSKVGVALSKIAESEQQRTKTSSKNLIKLLTTVSEAVDSLKSVIEG